MTARQALVQEVAAARLTEQDWARVADVLDVLAAGEDRDDELRALLFEARVRSRYGGDRRGADVVPTKQTAALPVVGIVCAALLFGVGGLLGGGWILVGIAALAVFVFGIAFAGSRVAHRSRPGHARPAGDVPVPPPAPVRGLLDRLGAR